MATMKYGQELKLSGYNVQTFINENGSPGLVVINTKTFEAATFTGDNLQKFIERFWNEYF